jgi:hypothetical protein
MRKNYTLSLDVEKTEALRLWLKPKGISFSGYIESLMSEQMAAVERFKIPADVSEMKLTEFAQMFQKMAVNLAREVKKDIKKG